MALGSLDGASLRTGRRLAAARALVSEGIWHPGVLESTAPRTWRPPAGGGGRRRAEGGGRRRAAAGGGQRRAAEAGGQPPTWVASLSIAISVATACAASGPSAETVTCWPLVAPRPIT